MITRSTMARALVEIARGQIGKSEIGGTNRGPQINHYFKAVGIEPGAPWCAAFVGWCIASLGESLGRRLEWSYSAYCPDLANWGKAHNCAAKGRAAPGMVMLQWHEDMGRYAHTGIVESVDGSKVTCIEGNTNESGGRLGIGVMRHTRGLGSRYLYVDLLAANQPPTPGRVVVDGHELPAWMRGDRLYTPARALAERLGGKVGWTKGQATVNEQALETALILGVGHVPARDVVRACGRQSEWVGEAMALVVK